MPKNAKNVFFGHICHTMCLTIIRFYMYGLDLNMCCMRNFIGLRYTDFPQFNIEFFQNIAFFLKIQISYQGSKILFFWTPCAIWLCYGKTLWDCCSKFGIFFATNA